MMIYLIALTSLLAIAVGWILWKVLGSSVGKSWPCYRCGGPAEVEYMGLHYCQICRQVVLSLISTVQHDPPYGFPGAKGYLEFPEKELKE